MPAPVTDLSTALVTGVTAGLVTLISAIPAIVGALLILVVGWIIAGAVAGLIARGLRAIRVDAMADRAGVTAFLRRAQVHAGTADIVAGVVKWYIRLIFVLMAADALGLTAVSTIVNQILAFIPNLLVATLILAAFSWLASLARNVVTNSLAPTMANAKTLGVLAFAATFGFGVVAAATQIGVATTLIDILFAGLVGALALALGLAFGLGGREEAGQLVRDLRSASAPSRPAVEGTAAVAPAETGSGNGRPMPAEPIPSR
jgi:hypothetical protein